MAGVVPAIHVLLCSTRDVDVRQKSGHDREAERQLKRYVLSRIGLENVPGRPSSLGSDAGNPG